MNDQITKERAINEAIERLRQAQHSNLITTDELEKIMEVARNLLGKTGPECTMDEWAGLTGLTRRAVESTVARGHLPVVRRGKRVFVNVAAITVDNILQAVREGFINAA
jgi:hypothetical protein